MKGFLFLLQHKHVFTANEELELVLVLKEYFCVKKKLRSIFVFVLFVVEKTPKTNYKEVAVLIYFLWFRIAGKERKLC